MLLDDTPPAAGRGARFREMQFTGDGLVLGEGTVLAKMNDEGLCVDEERVLTCLAVAFGPKVPPAAIGALHRAAKCWRSGDKALAAIHLAQIGLRKIDGEDAHRLRLAAKLIDGGMRPRDLTRELGLGEVQPHVSKYSDNQPRVPAGNGSASGQGAGGQGAAAGGKDERLVEGRSAAVGRPHPAGSGAATVTIVPGLPKDAIVVRRPNGKIIDDPGSRTRKLMAPPRADFQEVYAAGQGIADLSPFQQYAPAGTALRQFGTYDFQRDRATNSFFSAYVPAANYAIGVYMAGAGYNLITTHLISEGYALRNSRNALTYNDRKWITRGWEDAKAGYWK